MKNHQQQKRTFPGTAVALASMGVLCSASITHARENMGRSPSAVSIIDRESIEQQSTFNIGDLGNIAPHQPGMGGATTLDLRNLGRGHDPLVRGRRIDMAGADIARIPVLRGTQGVLFGKNSTSGVITTGFTTRVDVGYTGNVRVDPVSGDSSAFISAGVGYAGSVPLGSGTLNYAAGASYTRYDKGLDGRPGDDHAFYDYSFRSYYKNDLSYSTRLEAMINLRHGEHATVAEAVRPGVLHRPLTSFSSGIYLTQRFDGGSLDDDGLFFRTGLYAGFFNESGGDFADSHRFGVTQEVLGQLPSGTGWYARVGAGVREFEEMDDYDSFSLHGVGGVVFPLPGGAQLKLGAGVEHRSYDGSGIRDRNVPVFEGYFTGYTGETHFAIGARYGIFNKFANWSGGNSVDMEGLECSARVTHPFTDRLSCEFSLESSYLNADSSAAADGHVSHQRVGALFLYEVNDRVELEVGLSMNRVDVSTGVFSSSETYGASHFGITSRF